MEDLFFRREGSDESSARIGCGSHLLPADQTANPAMRVSSLSRVVGTAPPCGHHPSRLQAKAHSVRCSSYPGRRDVLRSTASVLMAAALPSAAEELPLVPRADLTPGLSISRVSR